MARNKYPEKTYSLIVAKALELFLQNGYEHTSVQDIVNNLGGLSKGAIYHHFKSKEEIFEAVLQKILEENTSYFIKVRDAGNISGAKKLKMMIKAAYINPRNDTAKLIINKFMTDPKFLANHILNLYSLVASQYIEPIIKQGIKDGSIITKHPKELAEVIATLLNIWLNPLITKTTQEEMLDRLKFFSLLLKGLGLEIFEEGDVEKYSQLCNINNH